MDLVTNSTHFEKKNSKWMDFTCFIKLLGYILFLKNNEILILVIFQWTDKNKAYRLNIHKFI